MADDKVIKVIELVGDLNDDWLNGPFGSNLDVRGMMQQVLYELETDPPDIEWLDQTGEITDGI